VKIISRAAAVTVSAAAALAFMAPAAQAAPNSGVLRVCVLGLDDDDAADVDIRGRGTWSGEINGCKSFRAPRGVYTVDIDEPDGYDIVGGDDDRTVRVGAGKRTTVKFWLDGDGDAIGGQDHDDDDDVTFARADDDGDCPDGYRHSRVDDDICVRG
jgi:hypothetical protein